MNVIKCNVNIKTCLKHGNIINCYMFECLRTRRIVREKQIVNIVYCTFVNCLLSPVDGSKGYTIRACKRRNKEMKDFKR